MTKRKRPQVTEKTRRSAREEACALALARGATTEAAGRAAGVSGRTVRRWLKKAEFGERVLELRSKIVERAAGALASCNLAAVKALKKLLDVESATARLGAARAILEFGIRVRESSEGNARDEAQDRRLKALESQLAGRDGKPSLSIAGAS